MSSNLDKIIEEADKAISDASFVANLNDIGTSLVKSGETPEEVKARLAKSAVETHNAHVKAMEATAAAKAELDEMRREMERKIAEMEAQLRPVMESYHRIQDGMNAMNLYLGRDEYIHPIRTGVPSPKEAPIVIRQQVLAMDEESGLFAERGGMDSYDIEKFDEWLLEDPSHLNQVLPEEKGIVVLRVRRTEKKYQDPWEALAKGQMDSSAWWLIRNGENLYRMNTDFYVGETIVPKSDEFTKLFFDKGWFGGEPKPLEPGTDAWIRAEAQADAKTRHYMKIALILQGLIDRTTVLLPLPVDELSFVEDRYYDEGYVKIITDAENALGDNIVPFYTWLRNINKKASVGARIILGKVDADYVYPKSASYPDRDEPHTISAYEGSMFVIKYKRTDMIWVQGDYYTPSEYRPAKTSARYLVSPEYVEEYFALDYASVEEIERYLKARSQRHHYESMFPLLKRALAIKKQEAEAEEGMRTLLEGELGKINSTENVDELINWWKTSTGKYQPLVGSSAIEKKSSSGIIAEAKRRMSISVDVDVVESIKSEHPDYLLIGRASNGYVVFVPETFTKPFKKSNKVFVTKYEYNASGTLRSTEEWKSVSAKDVAKVSIIEQTEEWNSWEVNADPNRHLTEPERDALLTEALDIARSHDISVLFAAALDFGEAWDSDYARIDVYGVPERSSEMDNPKISVKYPYLVSSSLRFRIQKEKGVASIVYAYNSVQHEAWTPSHNHLVSPTVTSKPSFSWNGNVVWSDDEKRRESDELLAEWEEKRVALALLEEESKRLVGSIELAWKEMKSRELYQNFIEDYNSDELWEVEKESRLAKIVYPYSSRDTVRNMVYDATHLVHLVRRLIETGNAPYNKTVQEAYDSGQFLLSDVHQVEIPDDIKDIKFASEVTS